MTTVKEFKDLGVEFVADDELSGRLYKIIFAAEHLHALNIRNLNADDAKLVITSFAWRPLKTLPDNPKFKYEKSEFDSFWRPLLDQSTLKPVNGVAVKPSDDKPAFTQAMADKGELPPIGGKCIAVYMVGSSKHEADVTIAHINGDQVACIDSDNNYLIQYIAEDEYFKPIDTRTPKQKAVDAACESIGQGHNTIVINIVGELYDNGFIKC